MSNILTNLDLAVCVGGILTVMAIGMIASRKEEVQGRPEGSQDDNSTAATGSDLVNRIRDFFGLT